MGHHLSFAGSGRQQSSVTPPRRTARLTTTVRVFPPSKAVPASIAHVRARRRSDAYAEVTGEFAQARAAQPLRS